MTFSTFPLQQQHPTRYYQLMENKNNPLCYFGWSGLLIIVFGAFSLGYGFSRSNFSAHRKGLIIAGSVAVGIICVGILTCVLVSWHRKRQTRVGDEELVVSQPTRRQPDHQPPMTTNPVGSCVIEGTDAQQPNQRDSLQQSGVHALPEKPPPTYTEVANDRVYRDPNPTSLLNV